MSRSNGNGSMGPPPYSRQGPGNNMPVNESDGYYGRGGPGGGVHQGSSGNRPPYSNTNNNSHQQQQQQYGSQFDSRGPHPQSHLNVHVPPQQIQTQPLPAKIIPLTYFQKCIPQTRTIAHYKRIEQIGEGTYGQVYKAACLSSSRIVALKKIRLTSVATEGLPRTVIREIKILKALKHENMVQMLEVVTSKGCEHLDDEDEHKEDRKRRLKDEEQQQSGKQTGGSSGADQHQQSSSNGHSKSNNNELTNQQNTEREKYKGNLFLVLEYISHDLSGILDMGVRFTPVQSKCIFRQLLSVLQYMHEKRYVHRDLKSSNILVDERYRVKLADFGLARSLDDEFDWQTDQNVDRKLTNKVVTIWYRCPELLLGATNYDEKVDIWSAGCILAELLLGKALFPGTNEVEQLRLIFKMMGTPNEESWEGINKFPKVKSEEMKIGKPIKADIRDKYGGDERFTSSPSSLALIERLLELDPRKRWRASQALESQYFRAKPQAPSNPEELGTIPIAGDSHEFQTKPIRKEAKLVAQKASADARKRGGNEKEAYDCAYKEYLAKAAESGPLKPSASANDKEKVRDDGDKDRKRRRRERDDSKENRDRREKDRDTGRSKRDHSREDKESDRQETVKSDKPRESDKRESSKADKPRESDKRESSKADKPRESDKRESSKSDKPRESDKRESSKSDKPRESDKRESSKADKSRESDKRENSKADKPRERESDKRETSKADKPRDRESDKRETSKADKPRDSDKRETSKADKPRDSDKVDKPRDSDKRERTTDEKKGSHSSRGKEKSMSEDKKDRSPNRSRSRDRDDKDSKRSRRESNDSSREKKRKDRGDRDRSRDRNDRKEKDRDRSRHKERRDKDDRRSREKDRKEKGNDDRHKDKRERHRHRSSRDPGHSGSRDGSRRSREHDRRDRDRRHDDVDRRYGDGDRRYDDDPRRGEWGGDERGHGRRDHPPSRDWDRPRDVGPPPGWQSRGGGPKHRDDRYRK